MSDQMIFKRYEIKYLIRESEYEEIKRRMAGEMIPDVHGENTIQSLYLDTPEWLLARRSIDKPFYKEKLRLRSYGLANGNTPVFIELKKKYDGVVYKRRLGATEEEAWNYLLFDGDIKDSQIKREIDYVKSLYKGLMPRVLLSYEREAFYHKDDYNFRITFDRNILWRDCEVNLTSGIYGSPILGDGYVLMEVKVAGAIPMWFAELLSELKIYKTSFSKYGTAYKEIQRYDKLEDLVYGTVIQRNFRHNEHCNNFSNEVYAMS